MTKYLFIDESGNSNLAKPDLSFPVFALGAVIVDKEKLHEIEKPVRAFKHKFFGSAEVVLHMSEITKNSGAFKRIQEAEFRDSFYLELGQLLNSLDIEFVYGICDTNLLSNALEKDCYAEALKRLVDEVMRNVDHREHWTIFESGDKGLNKKIHTAWQAVQTFGTSNYLAKTINKKISRIELRTKNENVIGLQLCDLLVSQATRAYLGLDLKFKCKFLTG